MAPYASLRRTEVGCRPMKSKVSTVSEGTEDRTDELVTNFLASNLRVDVRKGRVELMGHPMGLPAGRARGRVPVRVTVGGVILRSGNPCEPRDRGCGMRS